MRGDKRLGGRQKGILLEAREPLISEQARSPPVLKIILERRTGVDVSVGDYRCDQVSIAVGLFVGTQERSVAYLTDSDEKSAGLPPTCYTCKCIID